MLEPPFSTPGVFIGRSRIEAPRDVVFQWHARPGALERATPPWIRARVVSGAGGLQDGSTVRLRISRGPFHFDCVMEHRDYVAGEHFRDVQKSGPFASWQHTHRFLLDGETGCEVEDRIDYALPLGAFGRSFGSPWVAHEIERMIVYGHRVLRNDLRLAASYPPSPPLRILVSGSSGLIGSALIPFLTTNGHRVARLVRAGNPAADGAVAWDPAAGWIHAEGLEDFDAVIHLAGEGIASWRWNAEKRARIRDSRARGTQLLCEALASLKRPPRVLLSASATGYYGDRGALRVSESAESGPGFLAQVCRDWEAATRPAADKGIRVANLRFGIVLTPAGGLLAGLLPAFLLGLGGPLGAGTQVMSWVAMDDVLGAIQHALMTDLSGPVNVASPYPETNDDFAHGLASVLGRPAFLRVPDLLLQLLFGQMANETLLASICVEPRKLVDTGYAFLFPRLETALQHLLGRT